MVTFDDIIFKLQRAGGISELFRALLENLDETTFRVNHVSMPALGRYTDDWSVSEGIFHSSYYRLAKKVPCVTTVHDFVYERYSSGIKKTVHTLQKKRACEGAAAIICVSNATRNDLISLYGEQYRQKSFVVYNGVSPEFKWLGNERERKALFVGARKGYKNFDNLVRAVSEFKDLSLTIVGGGELDRREQTLLKHHMPDRFQKIGYCSNSVLMDLYNNHLFFGYPSVYEGFGIPVIEAQKCGCPVLAVESKAVKEVGGAAVCYAETGSANDLHAQITRLLSGEYRDDLAAAGALNAQKFSWSRCTEETSAIYASLGH